MPGGVWVQVPLTAVPGAERNLNGSGFAPFRAVLAVYKNGSYYGPFLYAQGRTDEI